MHLVEEGPAGSRRPAVARSHTLVLAGVDLAGTRFHTAGEGGRSHRRMAAAVMGSDMVWVGQWGNSAMGVHAETYGPWGGYCWGGG